MKWSLKLGQVAGIGIYVHWTFLILVGYVLVHQLVQGAELSAALLAVGFVLTVFGCVTLHELGHALAARHYNISTRDITLLPIGGVARLERMPDNPVHELWVALAGPAVNVVIAGVLLAGFQLTGGVPEFPAAVQLDDSFLAYLMLVNGALVVFNLLPAFPMDGGRVLRALLALRLEYLRATQIAATVGQVMAILFGVLGLLGTNPVLIIIALFVYLGAQAEAHQVQMRSFFQGIPVRDAMITDFRALSEDESLHLAIEALLSGTQQDFPVLDEEKLVGLLFRKDLIRELAAGRGERRVGDVMRRDCQVVDDLEMLERAFLRMRATSCSTLPVVRDDRLVGMLTLENVGELMMVNAALHKARSRSKIDDIYRHPVG